MQILVRDNIRPGSASAQEKLQREASTREMKLRATMIAVGKRAASVRGYRRARNSSASAPSATRRRHPLSVPAPTQRLLHPGGR